MSLIGGTAVDLGDMAVTAGLSTVGSMVGTWGVTAFMGGLGIATAPAWATVGLGVAIAAGAAWGVSKLSKKWGVGKFIKNKWNDFLEKNMRLGRS